MIYLLVFSKDDFKKPHAALMTTSIPVYLSFYPNLMPWPSFVLCSLDCDEKYQSCSHYIRIPSLEDDGYGPSERRIKQFFESLANNLPIFGMLNYNCSAIVMDALFHGCVGEKDLMWLILSYRPWIFTPGGIIEFAKKFNNYLDENHRAHQLQSPTQVLDKKIHDLQDLLDDDTLTSIAKLTTIFSHIQSIQMISKAIFQDNKAKSLERNFDFYNNFINCIVREIKPYIANLMSVNPVSYSINDLIALLNQSLEKQPNQEFDDIITTAITKHGSLLLLANNNISHLIHKRDTVTKQLYSFLGDSKQESVKISNLTKGIHFWKNSPCTRFLSHESTVNSQSRRQPTLR